MRKENKNIAIKSIIGLESEYVVLVLNVFLQLISVISFSDTYINGSTINHEL